MTGFPLQALLVGDVRPLGPRGVPSGIAKNEVDRPLALSQIGLAGDAQGDTRHHGGPEKALHHYALDHYPAWIAEIGPRDVFTTPGAFGENLATLGLLEDDVAVGDVFALGSAIIEVSQGRQPCWKLNERFTQPDMARRVQATGRTGWYYRVLQPGDVSPDSRLERIHRSAPDWTISRIWQVFYVDTLNRSELEALAELPQLAEGWRHHARRRLETGSVEDWTSRLTGRERKRIG
ncbi:MAG: MOSC domain-containing protein [Flavobacteriaceae bacterium]